MKSTIALLAFLLAFAPMATAGDEYDDSQAHPLRVATYIVHPVGVLMEWVVFRPFHMLTSASPETEYVFGHRPHGLDEFAVDDIDQVTTVTETEVIEVR